MTQAARRNRGGFVFFGPLLAMTIFTAAGLGIVAGVHVVQENWDIMMQHAFGPTPSTQR